MPVHRAVFGRVWSIAAWAGNAAWLAIVSQVRLAIIFILKLFLKLIDSHLVNVHRVRGFWHGVFPLDGSVTP